MAIRREQPGAAKAAAAAGTAIGQARRAEEDRARAEREQARAAAEAERKQARAAAEAMQKQARQDEIKFAMQKRQVDWQRALDKERRQEDYQLAAEDRAVERGFAAADYTAQKSLERIEFGKDLDFQIEQKEYVQNIERAQIVVDAYEKQIKEGLIDPEKEPEAKQKIWQAGWDLQEAKKGNPASKAPNLRAQELTETRETRAEATEQRAQESAERAQKAFDIRQAAGSSFAEKRAADKYIEEHPEYRWWKDWGDPISANVRKIKDEAQQILAETSIVTAPTPNTREEYRDTYQQLQRLDPVKAQQYLDQFKNEFSWGGN